MNRYIKGHISNILTKYEPILLSESLNSQPFDKFMRTYLTENKNINSSDRRIIQQKCFDLIRHKTLLDEITQKPLTWSNRLDSFCNTGHFTKQQSNPSLPVNIQASLPLPVYSMLSTQYGDKTAIDYGHIFNSRAPLTIRANPIKTTRNTLFSRLKDKHKLLVRKCVHSPLGIVFMDSQSRGNLTQLDEFKQGLFEIQDSSSQLGGLQVQPNINQSVLDYCSGSGGKTLVFGGRMKGTGVIYLHDNRRQVLDKAKIRLDRAGITNYQCYTTLTHVNRRFDWLLLDVPCSGSGVFRRNVDAKHKVTVGNIHKMQTKQREIIDSAIPYLKKTGKCVYVTCSMFEEENIQNVKYMCDRYGMKVESDKVMQVLPEENGMDSLFSATLHF